MRYLVGLYFIAVAAFGLSVGWILYQGVKDTPGSTTCAVVFGGAPGPDGKPSAAVQATLDRTAQLVQGGTISQIIVIGGDAPPSVTDGMVTYLTQNGVPVSTIMVDHATSLDLSAHDVADYLKQNNLTEVMIVAPYYEIARTELALNRAGVSGILHVHSGAAQQKDLVPAAHAIGDVYVRFYQDHVAPTVTSLVQKASAEGSQLARSVQTAATPGATNSAPAEMTSTAATTNGAPVSPTTPEVALSNPRQVTATGIADFQVPGDWTQRVIPPILDPVWAGEGAHPYFLAALRVEHAGSAASYPDAVKSEFESSHRLTMGDVTQSSFTTSSGVQGVRMFAPVSGNGQTFEAVFYAFPSRQDDLVVLFSLCFSADEEGRLPLLDACARTVRPW